jgi:putative transposase
MLRRPLVLVLLRRVHGRYAQYYNARWGADRTSVAEPVFRVCAGARALVGGIGVRGTESGTRRDGGAGGRVSVVERGAHLSGSDEDGLLDMTWWQREGPEDWRRILGDEERDETTDRLRACTYAGRPFGGETFVNEMGTRFGRQWTRGRPKKDRKAETSAAEPANQFALF